eukprot:TRINITY_DN77645_c0_g1_i1.p1 TRINITY_DN77645_c0_g1~~TRINITY_DN77645_c0_g1_i1.p1  ORF type:complete len:155 (-),score=20.73 TRINITY_DN77645_c0_g1_i1:53-517(-)
MGHGSSSAAGAGLPPNLTASFANDGNAAVSLESLKPDMASVDPAGFEHYVELMRQGSAGAMRTVEAARLLQRQADRQRIATKAMLGALYTIADDPERLYADSPFPDFGLQSTPKPRVSRSESDLRFRNILREIDQVDVAKGLRGHKAMSGFLGI